MLRACIATLLLATAAPVSAATPDVANGGAHSLGLGTDGLVRVWGSDSVGQLGLGAGARTDTTLPGAVTGLAGITAISSGCSHTLALRSDGAVLSWGVNTFGQLGDGTTQNRAVPVQVSQLTDVTAISAGCGHSVALRRNGTVWTWGNGARGQLGDSTFSSRTTPVQAVGISNAVAIAAGRFHTVVLGADRAVRSFGSNFDGALGIGQSSEQTGQSATPVLALGLNSVVAIAAGRDFTLALMADGTVQAWGAFGFSILGAPRTSPRTSPGAVPGVFDIAAIAAGEFHSLALGRNGNVVAWGRNESGQLGRGVYSVGGTPALVSGLTGVRSIGAGFFHSVAVKADGTVWTWGNNRFGELGYSRGTPGNLPAQVPGLSGIVSADGSGDGSVFEIGSAFTVALSSDGTVLAWGDNSGGQLGRGAVTQRRATPAVVEGLTNVTGIAAGSSHSLAVTGDGRVFAWGNNFFGQLGDGTASDRFVPVAISLPSAATFVAAGASHSAAILADRSVWMWGNNQVGQLGDGTIASRFLPVSSGLTDAIAVAAGGFHTIAMKRDGSLWAWGANTFGSLGTGDQNHQRRPVPLQFLGAVAIAAEGEVSTVLRGDGTVWSFGLVAGVVGTTYHYLLPEMVTGLTDVIAIGGRAALRRDGTVWTWSPEGLLVAGSPQPRRLVARPIEGYTGLVGISRGSSGLRLGLRPDGSVISSGGNSAGEVGDGTFVSRRLPVVVVREGGGGRLEDNDWFLDLDPAVNAAAPTDKTPVFLAVARDTSGDITADLQFRASDIGSTANIYAFALAPADIVRPAAGPIDAMPTGLKARTGDGKETAVSCVLAQLNSSGQLQQVSASSLQAFVTGVLGAQGQSVTVLTAGNSVNIGGATFFVGYGSSAQSMINGGVNRGVVSLPGAKECRPEAPQTGWWWYPPEDGRGYSIEVQGRNIFFAAFLYDTNGRSNWYVATGATSLDGSLFTGDLLSVKNGQTLFGDYRAPNPITGIGPITLAFNSATSGTMVWPGGTVPLERFNIVPSGLTAPLQENLPEAGWWWNPAESGRGFFIEWQSGSADIAGYMYDDFGEPVWYLTVQQTPDSRRLAGSWWSFANGMTLMGPWKPNTRINDNVAPVSIQFHSHESATLTLPGGRTTNLVRHRF